MAAPIKFMRTVQPTTTALSTTTISTYTIGCTMYGSPPPSYMLVVIPLDQAITYAAALAPSQGYLETATTAALVITFYANGTSFGTMTFAAGAQVATFSGGSVSYPVGTVITAVTPATIDATASNLGFTLSGQKASS
jgi:hypothetical protein